MHGLPADPCSSAELHGCCVAESFSTRPPRNVPDSQIPLKPLLFVKVVCACVSPTALKHDVKTPFRPCGFKRCLYDSASVASSAIGVMRYYILNERVAATFT